MDKLHQICYFLYFPETAYGKGMYRSINIIFLPRLLPPVGMCMRRLGVSKDFLFAISASTALLQYLALF